MGSSLFMDNKYLCFKYNEHDWEIAFEYKNTDKSNKKEEVYTSVYRCLNCGVIKREDRVKKIIL